MILDASCAPSNIKYPQDFQLLSDGREKLQSIIDRFCKDYSLAKPRMYRKEARKNYLKLAAKGVTALDEIQISDSPKTNLISRH